MSVENVLRSGVVPASDSHSSEKDDTKIKRRSDQLIIAGSFVWLVPLLQILQLGATDFVDGKMSCFSLTTLQAICLVSAGLSFTANSLAEYWSIRKKGVTLNLKTIPITEVFNDVSKRMPNTMNGLLDSTAAAVVVSQAMEIGLNIIENPNTYHQLVRVMEGFRFDKVLPVLLESINNRNLLMTMTVASILSLVWAGIHSGIATGKADPVLIMANRFGDWREKSKKGAVYWLNKELSEEKYLNIS